MKTYAITVMVILGMTLQVHAQGDAGSAVKAGEPVKTMERQQVMANYLQAVATNLTGTDKKVALKATLFALDGKDSADKHKSTYYLDHHWQRNTQLLIGSALDKNSNINGISLGININVLNKRDPSEVDFWRRLDTTTRNRIGVLNTTKLKDYQTEKLLNISNGLVRIARQHFRQKEADGLLEDVVSYLGAALPPKAEKEATFRSLFGAFLTDLRSDIDHDQFSLGQKPSLDRFARFLTSMYFTQPLAESMKNYFYAIDKNGKAPDDLSADQRSLIEAINADLSIDQAFYQGKDLVEVYTFLHKNYQETIDEIAKAPLLTLGYNYTYATSGINYVHVPAVQYIKGIFKNKGLRSWEFSALGADSICTDTGLTQRPVNRHVGVLQIGLTKVCFTDKANVSLLEAKFALEGDLVISGQQIGEDKFKPIGSITLQGRPSARSPWFKLVTKYDKSGKFFGAINVTLNLDNSANKGS